MMAVFGTKGKLQIDDSLDNDGEAEIFMEHYSEQISDWLGKESAVKLIAHLKQVFEI